MGIDFEQILNNSIIRITMVIQLHNLQKKKLNLNLVKLKIFKTKMFTFTCQAKTNLRNVKISIIV